MTLREAIEWLGWPETIRDHGETILDDREKYQIVEEVLSSKQFQANADREVRIEHGGMRYVFIYYADEIASPPAYTYKLQPTFGDF